MWHLENSRFDIIWLNEILFGRPDHELRKKFHSEEISFLSKFLGFPDCSVGKQSACNARNIGDAGSVPGWVRSPGDGHGNPLQYFCQEIPRDRGARRATVHRVAKSRTRLKRLSTACFYTSSMAHAELADKSIEQLVRRPEAWKKLSKALWSIKPC